MLKNCEYCGQEFNTSPAKVKLGFGRFCSRDCYKFSIREVIRCDYCGKNFFRRKAMIKPGRKYCSTNCRDLSYRGSKFVGVYRGYRLYMATNGYIKIVLGRSKEKLFHVFRKEEELGHPIPKGFNVHHINGNVQDNRLENLQVISASEHTRLHGLQKSEQKLIASGGIPGVHKKCPVCGLVKELTDFPKSRQTHNGIYPYCKDCSAARTREYKRRKKCQ